MVQWNRRLSFPRPVISLSIVAAVVAIAAVPLLAKFPGKAQKDAIAKLKGLGAVLEFDDYENVTALRLIKGMPLTALDDLRALPRLQKLHLPLVDIGDDDLARVGAAVSLEELILSGNQRITDAGLKNLEPLVHLKLLFMTDVPIEGPGLKSLGRLPRLEVLDLAQSKITNPQLAHLSRMPSLRYLNVSTTEISDQGLEHLRPLKTLENLVVINTAVTNPGGAELQKSLPRLQIQYRF
jgi:Leucine Rich repeat